MLSLGLAYPMLFGFSKQCEVELGFQSKLFFEAFKLIPNFFNRDMKKLFSIVLEIESSMIEVFVQCIFQSRSVRGSD